jgi:hypothetical protein
MESIELITKAPINMEIEPYPYPSSRINLSTVEDVRREMAKVYRDSRQQKIMPSEGTKLVFMLTQILKAHELYMIEKRLSELELSYSRGSL